MTNELEPLKECPHCGKTRTLELTDCVEVETCAHFEECSNDHAKCVVCNVNKGGCGASGGFAYSEEEAIKKWNARYKRTCTAIVTKESYPFASCSECGCKFNTTPVYFCRRCGAEVVDGD